MADIMDSWQKIQQGAKEAERLINQGQYNLSIHEKGAFYAVPLIKFLILARSSWSRVM